MSKEDNAQKALLHTDEMERAFHEEILDSVRRTEVISAYEYKEHAYEPSMTACMSRTDTVSALVGCRGGRTALLNFASYKHPGGKFTDGSMAQEEALCHASDLYNVLRQFRAYYDWNNAHKNRALYLDRALYTPDVIFNEEIPCDVITCAAPNRKAAMKYTSVTDEENSAVLDARIRFVLEIAADHHVDTLILGAYGCGVFGQSAEEVGRIFRKYLENQLHCFKRVVFAVPAGPNYDGIKKGWGVTTATVL